MRKHKILLLTLAVSLTGCDWLFGTPPPEKRDIPSYRVSVQDCVDKEPAKVVVECNSFGTRCSCKDLLRTDGGLNHE
jgi:hypothetical protein